LLRRATGPGGTLALLIVLVLAGASARGQDPVPEAPPAVLDAMRTELDRQFASLSAVPEYPAYYLSYLIGETRVFEIRARWGSLTGKNEDIRRQLDIDLRVGSPELDNTHKRAGNGSGAIMVSIQHDPAALRSDLWIATEQRYRSAVEDYLKISAEKAVRVQEEDPSPDFCAAPQVKYLAPPCRLVADEGQWEVRVRQLSAAFRNYPEVLESYSEYSATSETRRFVNSEGSMIRQSLLLLEVRLGAQARAEDGMNFSLYRHYAGRGPEDLPALETLKREIREMGVTLAALKVAPLVDPYIGPAILSGKAAAVLFHEVLGHRLEGHRQKDEDASQTFTKKLGQRILPSFISVISDPTQERIEGIPLMGFYRYDDEGVTGQRVTLVEDGVLKSFLMSRSPVRGFPASNGHGRKELGQQAVGRQSNLIVQARKRMPVKELRKELIKLCAKQGRPYGLLFAEIEGGFTFTGRMVPNAFNVMPVVVWRIHADGRPDELVRGVDLIGTPLSTLERIVAAGDDIGVFNGYCGAESGYVPVAAASPSLLVAEVEVQRKQKDRERPPLLDPPSWDEAAE
jgi:TldD protein